MVEEPTFRRAPMPSATEFHTIRRTVSELTGIALDDSKGALMVDRLGPLLGRFGFQNYLNLCFAAQQPGDVRTAVIDAITTQETFFFRDPGAFALIGDTLIPELLNKSNTLRIWSAASSTGQEAYSIAMLLHEVVPNIEKYNISIRATDISRAALAYGSYGQYTKWEVERGLSPARRNRFFTQEDENRYRIRDELRYMVSFDHLNLLEPLTMYSHFDIILCRNVAIYFDSETKRRLINALTDCLQPNGKLLVGASETLWQVTDRLARHEVNRMVYYSRADRAPG